MKNAIIYGLLVILIILSIVNGVVITPDTVGVSTAFSSVTVDFKGDGNDPRASGRNVIENDAWKLVQHDGDFLNDWGLVLTLDSTEYGFDAGQESALSITMCAQSTGKSDGLDPFFAFSIGDQEYMTFVLDIDGYLVVQENGNPGLFVYPACQSTSLAPGTPVGLIPDPFVSLWTFRDALAGDNAANFDKLTSTHNGNNFPLKFDFINDDTDPTSSGKFTFRFSSPKFETGLECEFGSSVSTGQDFKLYVTPDMQKEGMYIKSFTINDDDIRVVSTECGNIAPPTPEPTTSEPTTSKPTTPEPTTAEPTTNPTVDGCDFDIDRYLEECYCSNDIEIGQRNEPIMGYQPYDGYDYNETNRLFILLVLSMSLNIILVSYGLCNKVKNKGKYEKVYVYSDTENQ